MAEKNNKQGEKRALVLFSGGLDSILAVKVLQEQGFTVYGIAFESAFFDAVKARQMSSKASLKKLFIVDLSKEILNLVKNPPHGYGKNLNPCIDCHGLMIKKAGEIAKKEDIVLVATGEVLGQRPFSQNKDALRIVKKISNVDVLRPLSAKLLEESDAEKSGIVDRSALYSIKGRSRNEQKKLIKKYSLKEFPSPAGGCLLTDPQFAKRLRLMLEYWSKCSPDDVSLLRFGRVFWFNKRVLLIVGRDKNDNEKIKKFAKRGDIMLELKNINGPLTLLRSKSELKFSNNFISVLSPEKKDFIENINFNNIDNIIKTSAILTAFYSKKTRGSVVDVGVLKL